MKHPSHVPIITALLLGLLTSQVTSYCWTPNNNPFTGPPDTERLEGSTGGLNDAIMILHLSSSSHFSSRDMGGCVPTGRRLWQVVLMMMTMIIMIMMIMISVEFLIKSHPLDSPSNYKLSDLTLKGKRTAVLAVPPGEDFIFQVWYHLWI